MSLDHPITELDCATMSSDELLRGMKFCAYAIERLNFKSPEVLQRQGYPVEMEERYLAEYGHLEFARGTL